jgi:ribosome-associated protein
MNQYFEIPEDEVTWKFSRSSGSGGQNINKVESKVTLVWRIFDSILKPEVKSRFIKEFGNFINTQNEFVISSQVHRSQVRNKETCLSKLHSMIASVWHPPKKRLKTAPKKSAILKRLKNKKIHSEKKRSRSNLD